MLAYPLAYIISLAALWGGGGFFLLEDKWLNFHWQGLAVVFPIWLWLPLFLFASFTSRGSTANQPLRRPQTTTEEVEGVV